MLAEERDEPPERPAGRHVIANDIRRERLRRQQQDGRRIVRMLFPEIFQPAGKLVQQHGVLLVLRHRLELMVRVEVGLRDHHRQRPFRDLLIPVPEDQGPDHRPEKRQRGPGHRRDAGFSVPDGGEPSVGERHHQPEHRQRRGPDPQRTAEGARELIPLDQGGRAGEGVPQDQPGPGNLPDREIILLPGDPGRGQEQIRQSRPAAAEPALRPTEQAENQRHLQRIGQHGENPAADRRVAHPERRHRVPRDERPVMPPPEMLQSLRVRHPLHAQQRHEPQQRQPAEPLHQERHAHQQHEQRRQAQQQNRPVLLHNWTKLLPFHRNSKELPPQRMRSRYRLALGTGSRRIRSTRRFFQVWTVLSFPTSIKAEMSGAS